MFVFGDFRKDQCMTDVTWQAMSFKFEDGVTGRLTLAAAAGGRQTLAAAASHSKPSGGDAWLDMQRATPNGYDWSYREIMV